MAQAGTDIDATVHKTNEWLHAIQEHLETADRHVAYTALRASLHAVRDRLPVEQFESRLALVRQAPNLASLEAIIADLDPSGEYLPATAPVSGYPDGYPGPVAPAESLRIAAILSSSKRAGSFTVPYRMEVKLLLGDLNIDLREAVFFSDVLEIELDALLGNFELILPVGTQVENECDERWSSTSHSTRSRRGAEPSGLLVRITGRVRWSNVEIKEKRRPGEEPSVLRKLLG